MEIKFSVEEDVEGYNNITSIKRGVCNDNSLEGICNVFIDLILGHGYLLSSMEEEMNRCIAERIPVSEK